MILFCTFALSFEGKTSRVDERQARSQSAHSAERLGTKCGKARQAQPSGSAEGEKRLEARMVGTEVANVRNTRSTFGRFAPLGQRIFSN